MSTTLPLTSSAGTSGSRPTAWRRRRALGLLAAVLVLGVACVLSVAIGSRVVAPADVVRGIVDPVPGDIAHAAVQTRLARTMLGALVGAALAIAGAMMQGLTRNPLADPALLGVSAGASFFVVVGMAYAGIATVTGYTWWALAGAAVTSVGVYAVGSLGRDGATPLKLALAGASATAAFMSLTSMVVLTRRDVFEVFRFWQVGGIGGATWSGISQVLPFLVAGAVISAACARSLNTLSLGDDVARGLGLRVGATRLLGALAAVLLCGAATAIAGPIGFLGLAMPHLARIATGPDYRWVLPYAALLGACLLLLADVAGRIVARPGDMDVAIMTAILGAPVFIAIVRRTRMREL